MQVWQMTFFDTKEEKMLLYQSLRPDRNITEAVIGNFSP